jgi:hypothetical protein
MELKDLNLTKLQNKLYADSPYDLASELDNAYRNGVDAVIDLLQETPV